MAQTIESAVSIAGALVGGGLALGGGAIGAAIVTVSPVVRPSQRSPASPRLRTRLVSTSS